MSGMYQMVKRALDLAASAGGLTVLSPLLCGIALAVRLDSPGPAFYRQRRLGKVGRVFELLKFRTMKVGADVVIGDDRVVVNPVNDPRVTRLGAVLRRTSIDELPQLFNVLRGEMSLVGPRPDLPEATDMYSAAERASCR